MFQEDQPQGSVLAPLLWFIYGSDIDDSIEAGESAPLVYLFADGVALLLTGRSLQECTDRLKLVLDDIS